MYVVEGSGTQTAYVLSSIRKLTFPGGDVSVHKTDQSEQRFALSDLRYLIFYDITVGIDDIVEPLAQGQLLVYPNPVSDVLFVDLRGMDSGGTLCILGINGNLLQAQNIRGSGTVILNLSRLPKGMYLCQFTNSTETRTVKIIKQ